jgi:hypothetical protein
MDKVLAASPELGVVEALRTVLKEVSWTAVPDC